MGPLPRYPILIPETSPTSCSFLRRAFNLWFDDDEDFLTGGWHFEECFFGHPEPTYAPLAGRNGLTTTELALGTKRVRDMGRVIADRGIQPCDGPVWVANH